VWYGYNKSCRSITPVDFRIFDDTCTPGRVNRLEPTSANMWGADDNNVIDSTVAINAALSALVSSPAVTIQDVLRIVDGGGTVKLKQGGKYKISSTLFIPANSILDLTGVTLEASSSATWTGGNGPVVDRVTVTNGGAGYTSAPTVTFDSTGTGGTGATAKRLFRTAL